MQSVKRLMVVCLPITQRRNKEMNSEAFVYCWTDHKTNMLYVGYHKHKNINKPFQDGYICDGCYEKDIGKHKKHSNRIWDEYQIRPQDFTRQIIAEGFAEDCRKLESNILSVVDAKNSSDYYNQHNGDGNFTCKGHTEEYKKWKSERTKGENNLFYGKRHTKGTRDLIKQLRAQAPVEMNERISDSLKLYYANESEEEKEIRSNRMKKWLEENGHPLKGKPRSEETIEKLRYANLNRSEEAKENHRLAALRRIGTKDSEETRKRKSIARRKRKDSPAKGKKWSFESRQNFSDVRSGRKPPKRSKK